MTIPRNLSFLAQGASATGVLSVSYGGTGLTTLTAGYIPYGNGTSAFASSAGLFFDGNNLGIGTSSPFADTGYRSMHINGTVTGSEINLSLSGTVYGQIVSNATVGLILNSTTTPMTFFNAGAERMRINVDGNVGVGTSTIGGNNTNRVVAIEGSGSSNLIVTRTGNESGALYAYAGSIYAGSNTNNPFILTTNGTERMRIDTAGIVTMSAYGAGAATFSASGVISSVSDETWKIVDGAPTNPDEMLKKLNPVYWSYNEEKAPIFGKERQLGFLAQNVHEAIGSEAAPVPEEGKPWGYYDRSVLAVTVMSLKNALQTIQELNDKFDAYVASHP